MSELEGQMTLDIGGATPRTAGAARPLPVAQSEEDERRLDVLAGQINALEGVAKETFRRTAIEIGQRLIEARGLVPAGRWGEWLRANIDYSERKAQQLMQVAEAHNRGELPARSEALSFTQIYALLSAPAEEREALAEEAAREDLSTRELQAKIKELNEERMKLNRDLYDMIQQQEADKRAIERAQSDAEGATQAMADLQDQLNEARDAAKVARERMQDAIEARKMAECLRDTALNTQEAALRELEELRAAPAEVREVMPEAEARELEELRAYRAAREAADATAAPPEPEDDARLRREKALAAAVQIRMAMKGMRGALPLMQALRQIDGEMAGKIAAEMRALAGEMTA